MGDQAEAYSNTRECLYGMLASCAKKISPLMESRANATLIDALPEDPHPHVRLCAVSGLKILGKGSSIGDSKPVRTPGLGSRNAPDIHPRGESLSKGSAGAPSSALTNAERRKENQSLKQDLQDIKAQLDVGTQQ